MDVIENFLSTKCIGKKNAVKISVLESMFQLKGSEVRKIINRIRCNGQPICSGSTGYYYASTEADIRKKSEILMAELPRSMQQRTDCKTR